MFFIFALVQLPAVAQVIHLLGQPLYALISFICLLECLFELFTFDVQFEFHLVQLLGNFFLFGSLVLSHLLQLLLLSFLKSLILGRPFLEVLCKAFHLDLPLVGSFFDHAELLSRLLETQLELLTIKFELLNFFLEACLVEHELFLVLQDTL